MASAPPSFDGGNGPQVARLPNPIDVSAPLQEGVAAVAQSVASARQSSQATDDRVREARLQAERVQYERNVQMQTGDAAAYIATSAGDLGADLINLREQSGPGGAGHAEAVDERIAKFRSDTMSHLGNNPEITSRFIDNIASIGANARVGELRWVAEQRALKSSNDYDVLDTAVASNIRTAVTNGTASGQTLSDAAALRDRAIAALPLPGTVKETMKREGAIKDNVTAIQALTDVNPHAAIDQIDKGALNMVPDKMVDQLRERARVAADRLDNQAKQATNEAAGVARAEAGNLVEEVNAGTHVDPTALQTFYNGAAASQKPEDIRLAHDLTIAIAKNAVTLRYDNSPPAERVAAMHEIEGHKGWQADEQLTAAHTQLQTLIGRDATAAEHDPVSLYARQTSQALPALALADPKVMGQRFILADRAAERFGKPVPAVFTDAEAGQLRQQYNQASVDGKAEFIQQLGTYGSARARQMMLQIAPTKPELTRLAELSASRDPAVQSIVREASDGSAQPLKDGVAAAVRSEMQRTYGAALARLPGDRSAAIGQVATWIYAHRAAASGGAATFDPALAQQSIAAALGGAGGKGGIGQRNGGDFVLPMGATQDDFDRVMALGAAHPEIVRAAANGVPQWAGRDLHARDFLNLVPVLINDTGTQSLYAFRSKGGSGYVKTSRGEDYVVDMRRLSAGLQSVTKR